MLEFQLRPKDGFFTLTGGQLAGEAWRFPEPGPDQGVRIVGFLSQKLGSTLRIFDKQGNEVTRRKFEPLSPLEGAIGGLVGPTPP